MAEMDFGDGQVASVYLTDGSVGAWQVIPASKEAV
jgi:hypothetical protein